MKFPHSSYRMENSRNLMTRVHALFACLILIAAPLSGCLSGDDLEELVDDIIGCMDENAENYDDNATSELVGDCIYMATMDTFMDAMADVRSIEEMLEDTPKAGYSQSITMNEWNDDLGMQMDIQMDETVMADLDNDAVHVYNLFSLVPMMTMSYTHTQIGEVVNVHYAVGGMMAGGEAESGSYQTRDATPNVLEVLADQVGLFSGGDEGDGMLVVTPDAGDVDEIPEGAVTTITMSDDMESQTMTMEYTEDGAEITMTIHINQNEDLMSFSTESDNGSATTSMTYEMMWGDAIVIEVDETLPKTSIPVWIDIEPWWDDDDGDDLFLCDNGNEIPWDYVDDGWDDCGDGSDESDDGGDDGDDSDDGDGPPTPEDAMEEVDTDGDGYMDLDEIQEAWDSDPTNPELDYDEVSILFDDCDYDDNDLIDIEEMQCFIDGIVDMLPDEGDEDPEQMFGHIDTDDDGYLSLQDLIDYLNNEAEQNGEEPMSSEDEEGTANWFYSGDTDGDDLLSLDEFTQLLESTGGDDIYWMDYYDGHCEWEGDADGEENAWYCKYSEDDEDWDTWWYYCEDHGDDGWHCTDDFGQSEEYEYTSGGNEWSGSDDDDDDGPPTPEEAMEAADANEDGYVSLQEFEDFWDSDPTNLELDSEEVAALADDCDYDGNDLIDIDEIQCFIDGIVDMLPDGGDENPEQMFGHIDTDDDGYVSLQDIIDFSNEGGDDSDDQIDEEETANWFSWCDTDGDDLLNLDEFTTCVEDDDDDDGEGGNDEPSRVTMMVMGQTLNAPISDFEVRFLVDCGEPDEEGNEPPISDCTIAASNGLTEGSATVDPAIAEYEFTYEYLDYDGDGLISDMDTLVIDNLMPGVQVELYDTWADQYTRESFATAEMLPGFGALMALTVLLGAAFATRRD